MKKKVTVIIPIYNTEKYLNRCLESVILQTYPNLEIILVDDGSTDNSGVICDNYAKKDSRVRVIHQINSGVSIARNIAIDVAQGEYIKFVDSDDTMDTFAIEKMIAKSSGCDAIISGFRYIDKINNNISQVIPEINKKISQKEFKKIYIELYKKQLVGGPCTCLYKTNIIKKNGIKFRDNMSYGEDTLFNLEYFSKCDSLFILNDHYYNIYRERSDSLTQRYNPNRLDNVLDIARSIEKYIELSNEKQGQEFYKVYLNHMIACIDNVFNSDAILSADEKRNFINRIMMENTTQIALNSIAEIFSLSHRVISYAYNKDKEEYIYLFFNFKKIILYIKNKLKRGCK